MARLPALATASEARLRPTPKYCAILPPGRRSERQRCRDIRGFQRAPHLRSAGSARPRRCRRGERQTPADWRLHRCRVQEVLPPWRQSATPCRPPGRRPDRHECVTRKRRAAPDSEPSRGDGENDAHVVPIKGVVHFRKPNLHRSTMSVDFKKADHAFAGVRWRGHQKGVDTRSIVPIRKSLRCSQGPRVDEDLLRRSFRPHVFVSITMREAC